MSNKKKKEDSDTPVCLGIAVLQKYLTQFHLRKFLYNYFSIYTSKNKLCSYGLADFYTKCQYYRV